MSIQSCLVSGIVILVITAASVGAPWDLKSDSWVATDALGRQLPDYAECGSPRSDKTVGIFYVTWHAEHVALGPYNISAIMAANPNALNEPNYTGWGPLHTFHHWGEPEYGYFRMDDPYVIRKDCELLTQAGVDVVVFDATNTGWSYFDRWDQICQIYMDIRNNGGKTPQICFMARYACECPEVPQWETGQNLVDIYNNWYMAGKYPELWFKWNNKPLLLYMGAYIYSQPGISCNDPPAPPEPYASYFAVRRTWAWSSANWFTDSNGYNRWLFHDWYPQAYGWITANVPEQTSVSIAMQETYMTASTARGRHYHNGSQPPSSQWNGSGDFFAEQWFGAHAIDPAFVFINSWNEWTAQRFVDASNKVFFVDQFTQEYSRDVAPMKDGHTDNYYYQMVDHVRRYKGVRAPELASLPQTITIDGSYDDWADVGPEYRDSIGDTLDRNNPGWNNCGPYVKTSGRNDIVASKVANDAVYVYFYARTDEPLTSYSGDKWMLLFIDADGNHVTGWEGYDYLVNSTVTSTTQTTLKPWTGSAWGTATAVSYRASGNEIEIRIPRSSLGLGSGLTNSFAFDFHWADNIQALNDITKFFTEGDSAPDRRFNYRYRRALDLFIDQGTAPEDQLGLSRAEAAGIGGNTVVVDIGGRNARQTDTSQSYFYFNADDSYVYNGNKPDVYITIDYYDTDSGTGTGPDGYGYIGLQYDSLDATAGPTGDGSYKSGGLVYLTGTNTWKQHTYHVADAKFANRENGGSDFRLCKNYTGGFLCLDVASVVDTVPTPARSSGPVPSDGAGGVDVHANMSWDGAIRAASYEVYFGTDPSNPTYRGQFTNPLYDPPFTLTQNTTYYWRVDVVNAFGTTTGELWSFDTNQAQIGLNVTTLPRTVQQGNNLPNDSFTVTNVGSGTLTYTISDNVSWLQVSPSSGVSTGEADPLAIIYATQGLGVGNYVATISVQDPNATNSPQTITVHLEVASSPVIQLSISSLSRSSIKGGDLLNDSFTVSNAGGGTLNYAITDNVGWLSVLPDNGASTGEADSIQINYSNASLATGTYVATISVQDPSATNSPQTITVNLEVGPAGDFNNDNDVDQEDFGRFQMCLSGSGLPYASGCGEADFDLDNDVDLVDFGIFQGCMAGADNSPGC